MRSAPAPTRDVPSAAFVRDLELQGAPPRLLEIVTRRPSGRRGTRLDAQRHRRALHLLAGLAIVLGLLMAISAATGCRHAPPVEHPTAPVVIERRACLAEEVEAQPPYHFAGPKEGCSGPWFACLRRADFIALNHYIVELQHYARDAYTRCGPRPVQAGGTGTEDKTP